MYCLACMRRSRGWARRVNGVRGRGGGGAGGVGGGRGKALGR